MRVIDRVAPRAWPWLLAVLALAAVFAWRTETSLDLGFHVTSGRWILEHRDWPRLDPFTYTLGNQPYVDMHGLFQIVMALAWKVGGVTGVGVVRLAFLAATLVLLWFTARRRGVTRPAIAAFVFALGICVWEMRFLARPELATYLLLALELYLVRRHAESGEPRWLFAVVPVQLVWTWSHALSLFGLFTLGLYATASAYEAWRQKRWPALEPWLALAASAAVMLLNPYGVEGLRFLWDLRTRIQSGNVFGESIGELASPFSPLAAGFLPIVCFFALLALTLIVATIERKRLRAFDALLVVAFGIMAAARVRNLGLYVVATLPVTAVLASALALRLRPRVPALVSRSLTTAAAAAMALLAAAVVSGGWYAANLRPLAFGRTESPAVYPEANGESIRALGLRGPIYNALDHGGYLALHLWPREKVFIDGRLEVLGDAFYRRYIALQSGANAAAIAQEYRWNMAIVPYASGGLLRALHADSTWALIALDGVSGLLVRNTPAHRAIIDSAWTTMARRNTPVAESEERLMPPPLRPAWVRPFVRRPYPFVHWGRGNGYALFGMYHAARREFAAALREGSGDEVAVIKNYALTCQILGRRDEAVAWFTRLLEVDPSNREGRAALAGLGG